MYAVDMVLLAPSRNELQEMINLCIEELRCLDLRLNIYRRVVLRMGKQCHDICTPIKIDNMNIEWAHGDQ